MIKILIVILLLFPSVCQANTRDGLIAWWKFDEISGNAIDSSWKANTGTPTGTIIIPNCQKSGCRSFNGTSDFITITGTSFPSIGNTPSIIAFVNPTSVADGGEIFGQSNTASALHFRLGGPTGTVDVFIPGTVIARTTATVPINTWSCIAYTRASGPVNKIYINGVNQSLSLDNGSSFTNTTNNKQIGQRGNSTEFFPGMIDDVRLYNRNLTQQEVINICNSGIILRGTGTTIKGTGTKLNY